jgi:hypothetical protein
MRMISDATERKDPAGASGVDGRAEITPPLFDRG